MNSELLCEIGQIYESLYGYEDQGPRDDKPLISKESGRLMKLTEKYFARKNDDKKLQKLLRQIQAVFKGELDKEPGLLDYESSR